SDTFTIVRSTIVMKNATASSANARQRLIWGDVVVILLSCRESVAGHGPSHDQTTGSAETHRWPRNQRARRGSAERKAACTESPAQRSGGTPASAISSGCDGRLTGYDDQPRPRADR